MNTFLIISLCLKCIYGKEIWDQFLITDFFELGVPIWTSIRNTQKIDLQKKAIMKIGCKRSGHCHAQAQALGPGRVHFVWWIYQLKWQFIWGKWWCTMFFCSTPFLKYELSRWTVFYTCSIEFYRQRPEVKKCLWPKGSACCHMDMKVELFCTFWLLKFVKVMKGHRERQPVGHQGRRLWSWQQRRIWRRGWWGPGPGSPGV